MDFLGLFYRKKNLVDLVGGPGGESPDDLGVHPGGGNP